MNDYRKNRCIEIARSLFPKKTGRCAHTAFILKNNKLLCMAMNNYSKQHLSYKFGEYKSTKDTNGNYIAGRHAEIGALSVYLRKFGDLDVSGTTLFVIRVGYNGQVMNSQPCVNCRRVLQSLPFKSIEWTE